MIRNIKIINQLGMQIARKGTTIPEYTKLFEKRI